MHPPPHCKEPVACCPPRSCDACRSCKETEETAHETRRLCGLPRRQTRELGAGGGVLCLDAATLSADSVARGSIHHPRRGENTSRCYGSHNILWVI